MCGTFMQILGQGAALYVLDLVVRPAFGGGFLVDSFLFLVKGFSTFWIYKWFQCGESGLIRRPMQGVSFWMALLGGVVGMFTLMITGSLLGETPGEGAVNELVTYGIEAVILNIVYGFSSEMIHDLAKNSLRNLY